MNKFWSIKNELTPTGENIGTLYLYGTVSAETWWGDEVTPIQFKNDLETLGSIQRLHVHIFSDGGDVFAGNAIHSMLKQLSCDVHVYIEGIAASIASVIAMAGDKILISRSAYMMVHNASLGVFGFYNAAELAEMRQSLEKIGESIIGTYASRTGKSRDEIVALLDGESGKGTWLTAQECIDLGFADEFIEQEAESALDAVACIGKNKYKWCGHYIDLSKYSNAPEIKNQRRHKNLKIRKYKAEEGTEAIAVTCPECGAAFDVVTPADESTETDESISEGIEVTCPECGAVFIVAVVTEQTGDDSGEGTGSGTPAEDRYRQGILAERNRLTALDMISNAVPSARTIVDEAKSKGYTFEATARRVFQSIKNQAPSGATTFMNALQTERNPANQVNAAAARDDFDPTIHAKEAAQMISSGFSKRAKKGE